MIVFTVMDHDVLTANDFAGEAFLALNTIPGVTSTFNMNIENFDCVTQIDLPLLEMKDKSKFDRVLTNVRFNNCTSFSCRSSHSADFGRSGQR